MVPDKDIPRIDYINFLCLDAVLPRRKAHQHHLRTSYITTQPLYFILFVPHSIFMTDYALLTDELQWLEFLVHITLSWSQTKTVPIGIQQSFRFPLSTSWYLKSHLSPSLKLLQIIHNSRSSKPHPLLRLSCAWLSLVKKPGYSLSKSDTLIKSPSNYPKGRSSLLESETSFPRNQDTVWLSL